MNLSNLVMIVVVILLLGYFMSNNVNRKEDSSKSNVVDSADSSIENNVNIQNNNSNVINSNISGNNVNLSKESFQTTNNDIASVESYSHSYLINVDPVKDTNTQYFIELFNPKQQMNGVLHHEINLQPTIATKDATNINQHFDFIPLTSSQKINLDITSSDNLITIRKSVGDSTVILKYNGQLSVQPFRDGINLNKDHVFIARNEKKTEGISEQTFNRAGEYDTNFNFDGNMTTNDLNYGLYKTVQNINMNVIKSLNALQVSKEVANESNLLDNKPITITISDKKNESKAPFINSGSNKRSITEKFQEIDNSKKNAELQKLVQETIVSSNAEIKCPQLDAEKYIHVQEVDCLTCPKAKI